MRLRLRDPDQNNLVNVLYLSVLSFFLGHDLTKGVLQTGFADAMLGLLLFLLLLLLVGLIIFLLTKIFTLQREFHTVNSLTITYAEFVVVFANIYFLVQCVTIMQGAPAFLTSDEFNQEFAPNSLFFRSLVLYVDSLYYSLVTITTLGYGDITPNFWYSKLLTLVQVASGVYLAVFSINKFFSEPRSINSV